MFSSLYENLLTGITIYTVCLQFYVFYLIQYKSPKNMKGYRFFLNTFTFWDLVFTVLLGFFLQPVPFLPYVAATVHGLSRYFGREEGMITAALVFYAGSNVIMYQNLCLLYRYTILHSNKLIHNIFMSPYSKIVCGLSGQLISGFMGYNFYWALTEQEMIPCFMEFMINSRRLYQIDAKDTILLIDVTNPRKMMFLLVVTLLFIACELVSIVYVLMIMSILKKNATALSHNAYKIHKQFTVLLGIQLTIPLVFVFFPVTACVFAIIIHRPMSEWSINFGFLLLSSYGAFNSQFTILCVSSYKWHAYNTFIRPWLKPLGKLMGVDEKLPKHEPQPEAPPTTTDQGVKRNKIDVCGGGLQMVET